MLNTTVRTAALAGVLLISGVSNAADVYLQTQAHDKDLFDSEAMLIESVPMWSFVCDTAAATAAGSANSNCTDSPSGAQIDLATTDTLTIYLNNTLNTAVSIVIPGQVGGGDPTWLLDDGTGRRRVTSFTQETPAGGTEDYTWSALRPGTYLYQSGTHPSIQVPMGLYGALVVGPVTPTDGACASGEAAYDSVNSCYDADTVMLFSELDPWQNTAVADACAGASCDVASYPSTVDYSPTYLLINGELSPALPAVDNTGNNVLLRFLNAGLRTHTPSTIGIDMGLLAEDGNAYPGNVKLQNTVVLAAGKTLDALVAVPAGNRTFSIFDRMPNFTNNALPDGGMGGTYFDSGTGSTSIPTAGLAADDGPYVVPEDCGSNCSTPWSDPSINVLENDSDTLNSATVVTTTSNGTLVLDPSGAFTYAPNQDFSGSDSFTYNATDGANTYGAQVTLNVSFLNDAPVAADDGPYVNTIGTNITVDAAHGVLGNDVDPDGDVLVARSAVAGLQCETDPIGNPGVFTPGLCEDGSFIYTGGVDATFDYDLSDDGGVTWSTSAATATLTVRTAPDLTLTVQEPDGTPVIDYRWTVEEDRTWHPDPDMPQAESLATNFHTSYMPVVAQGCSTATACSGDEEPSTGVVQLALDPDKHYYVSVLPADAMDEDGAGNRVGHTVGGAQILPGAGSVTVIVNKEPLPYAQISIFVFDDSRPTNGAVDLNENGIGGFQITLEDAGGRYGISAGAMSQDADGNLLTNALDCFDGAPSTPGVILSCPQFITDPDTGDLVESPMAGQVLIKNLFPGKYGIITAPPPGTEQWVQTSTIEGTKVIDAWVKAGEPPFFSEFGPVGVHAFVGFVNPGLVNARRTAGANTVSGAVTNYHMSRPPNQALMDSQTYDALMHTKPWVGLNSSGGVGRNIAAVQAEIDDVTGRATFDISNVPDGNYQVVVWDSYLDQVIAYRNVSFPDVVNPPLGRNPGDVGNVPVFNWFARLENHVFLDDNENGMRDEGEGPISEQAVNLRWRDGSVYQSFPTDLEGFVPFDQVFPFFNWLVAEVDYTRFKATGLTVTVDHGGDVSNTGNVLNPQEQDGTCTQEDIDNDSHGCTLVGGSHLQRTETGPVLSQGFQGFLGQTSVFEWGKKPYAEGENGGISGIVYYGVTRAESEPRLAAAEPWEPGIAGATVRLYRVVQTNEAGDTGLVFVKDTFTDSWDDPESLPTGCPGAHADDANILEPDDPLDKCYDGLRNFNQARPAVFDGGYAFNDIAAGEYVVEVVPPQGYELMKEEDVNVSFGDGYAPVSSIVAGLAVTPLLPDAAMVAAAMGPEPGLAQPPCVGEPHDVPLTMSLFPKRNEEAPFAGATRPRCDRKFVVLSDQGQAAADFTLMTSAPIASHFTGMVLDDVAQEFNPLSPQFGEKWAPPFVPVSVKDYKGQEISRVYSDQWGRINGLLPSTFTAYMPSPSGFSPAMHMTCMNDPGPIQGPEGLMVDPQYNPAYSNFCYTFQYMPGTTTYLDTPVLPVSAFASGYNPVDCSLDTGTPMIHQVDGRGVGPLVTRGELLTITSLGTAVDVPNPAYEGPIVSPFGSKTVERDYGFGSHAENGPGKVTIGGRALEIVSWTPDTITARAVGQGGERINSGQLVVTRDNGNSTEHAIFVTVDNGNTNPIRVSAGGSIQEAIDGARPGRLILVEPGVYNESVIMWKPVRLQGAGAGSTIINAVKAPTESLVAWRQKMDDLFTDGSVTSLPNQLDGADGFTVSEGAAITVLGIYDPKDERGNEDVEDSFYDRTSRIDGFSITGADVGGGILVNSYAHRLTISNNNVFGNNGSYHGGIRVGQPYLELPSPSGQPGSKKGRYGLNDGLRIRYNSVTQNGGLGGAGGGVSIATGSDNYRVESNFVCGNFTTGDGGGIGHFGLSDNGRILSNTIVHNQSFNQAVPVSGGGIFIGGERPVPERLERDNPDTVTTGAGDVRVIGNVIQGNQAGAGRGGGIRTQYVNGWDVDRTGNEDSWWNVRIFDNTIVNNVAGSSGGGISLHDTIRGLVRDNTIARNDSTATVGGLIRPADPTATLDHLSDNQPAGISTEQHSDGLAAVIPNRNSTRTDRLFSTPSLARNILFENRSFHYAIDNTQAVLWPRLNQGLVGDCPAGADFWDLDARILDHEAPDSGGTTTTSSANPFVAGTSYCNGGRTLETTPGPMFALPALDEGGNAWVDVRYGPLTRTWPVGAAPWSYEVAAP